VKITMTKEDLNKLITEKIKDTFIEKYLPTPEHEVGNYNIIFSIHKNGKFIDHKVVRYDPIFIEALKERMKKPIKK
jgi:hypothetical protein